jgi:hypothetical protein
MVRGVGGSPAKTLALQSPVEADVPRSRTPLRRALPVQRRESERLILPTRVTTHPAWRNGCYKRLSVSRTSRGSIRAEAHLAFRQRQVHNHQLELLVVQFR